MNAAQSLQTALETLRARLAASLKRTSELVDQFKVCEAYSEYLRRPSHVTKDDLKSVAIMLRDRVPALRDEYALALRAFVAAGGQLGIHWKDLVNYYLRLGFRQELLPWRYWWPPATQGRSPSVYVLVYATAWLLNAILSGVTIIALFVALWWVFEPITSAQLSFPAFLQAGTVTLYIGFSVYNRFGNPITLLFSFWATPWYLVSRLYRSLHALVRVAWRRISNLLDRRPQRQHRASFEENAGATQRHHLTSRRPRSVPAAVSIVAALGVFGAMLPAWYKAKDRVITPSPVVPLPAPDPIITTPDPITWPSPEHSLPQPPVSKPDTDEQQRAVLEGHLATFRSELHQFIHREGGVITTFGEMDPSYVEQVREEYEAQTLDDRNFLYKLEEIRKRSEKVLDSIQAVQLTRVQLVEEARRLMEAARSLKTLGQSAGEDKAFFAAVEKELTAATRNLSTGESKLKQAAAVLDEIRSKCERYRYLASTEQARLLALRDDLELRQKSATAALDVIESLLKRATRTYEPLSQGIDRLRDESEESLEALTEVEDFDDATELELQEIIMTASALKERVGEARLRMRKLFGTAVTVIEEIEQENDKFAKKMENMTQDHVRLVEEAAFYPEINPGTLGEQIRVLYARSETLAQEKQRAIADLDMLRNQLHNIVQSASMQVDDIATKAKDRLAGKLLDFAMKVAIFIPLLFGGVYWVYQIRKGRQIDKIEASHNLELLLQYGTNSAHTFFERRAAVNRIAKGEFADQETLDKIKRACSSIENRGHRNDTWIAGQFAREAHEIERRIKEAESIL